MYRQGPSLIGLAYFIIGLIVAATHGYLAGLGSLSNILSAILAVALWPALLFGANLHVNLSMLLHSLNR